MPRQQSTSLAVKNQNKNQENEKAALQKSHMKSVEDLAATFSTASTQERHAALPPPQRRHLITSAGRDRMGRSRSRTVSNGVAGAFRQLLAAYAVCCSWENFHALSSFDPRSCAGNRTASDIGDRAGGRF